MIKSLVALLLGLLQLLFFARAILSWFQNIDNETVQKIYDALYAVTEPMIMPMRSFLDRFSWARECPIDLSFSFTFMVLIILSWIFG